MAGTWTLNYEGTEKSFADWGLDQETAELTQQHMGVDIFTVAMPGVAIDSDVEHIFRFEHSVTIYSGRLGGIGTWSGGTIEFQGKRMLAVLDGRPEYEGVIFQFGGPWYDIEQTPYQQTVYYWTGPGITTASYLVSDVILFQKVTAPGTTAIRNSGQQIQDILQHLLDAYTATSLAAPYQIGTIDPALNLPTYQARDIKCSEAIEICLKLSPDAVVYFDYTFSPPKIHIKNRGNLTAVNVPFADGVSHESLRLTPRFDLQAASVVLHYKINNTINGATYVEKSDDIYPVIGPTEGLRVLIQTIDLAGFSANIVSGVLSASAVSNTLAWWKKYIPELGSSKIVALPPNSSFTLGTMSAKDESGAAISLSTYPNVLDDGSSIAPWMRFGGGGGTPVVGVRATITAIATYRQLDDSSRPLQDFAFKELQARVTLTNAPAGTDVPYASRTSLISGEAIPTGLAQAVFNSLATLQYDGELSIVGQEVSGAPGMGNTLNLTGGRTEWTTMAALIQSVKKRYGSGRRILTVGPARHLSAGDLTQLFLFNRWRRIWVNPDSQATAVVANNGNVQLGTNAPKENTLAGLEERSLLMLSLVSSGTNANAIIHDADGREIFIGEIDHTGAQVPSTSSIELLIDDLEPDSIARNAAFRLFRFKDSSDSCNPKKMYVLCTAPEADP